MSETIVCRHCSSSISSSAKFCPNCGQKVTVNAEDQSPDFQSKTKIVCSSCGIVNEAGSQFCYACGIPLTNAKTAQPKTFVKPPAAQKTVKKSHGKKIPVQTIILIVFGLVIVGLLILEFQKPSPVSAESSTPMNPSAAVNDASVLQDIKNLESELAVHPDNSEALLQLANRLHDAKFFPRAIETYKKYLALNPAQTDAHVDLGICYFETGDTPKAVAEIESALRRDPKHQMAMFNLGIIQLSSQNMDEAKKWLKKCVEIDPESRAGKKAKEILSQH
ncbi:MAG: tetratricopeptide repeat protein [Bacteroidota bacterium]|nr:tetratricopeptide repeat protein [Bacteroidota bacterium]